MQLEFSIISKYFDIKKTKVFKGIGDDAALFTKDKKYYWAISTDTLNEKTHFLPHTSPFNLGWKSLAVNISDINAMGGNAKFALLSISLPDIKESWIKEFSKGFFSCAKKYGVELIGGDTTKGPLSINVCILGDVERKNVLLRSNAKPQDDVWVTGELGLAALGLAALENKVMISPYLKKKAIKALEIPKIYPSKIKKIAKLSNAAIDISDGLTADLYHILKSSEVGADIYLDDLPMNLWIKKNGYYDYGLNGGDDYQLILTASKKNRLKINKLNALPSIKLSRIGVIKKGSKLNIIDSDGKPYNLKIKGFVHFAS